jgi:F-type H+-transporting ATPase subunit b
MDKLINDFSPGLFAMQVLILLLLILIMRKFAWKPILKSLDDREDGIKTALEAAENAENQLRQLEAQNDSMLKEARAERDELIKDATATSKKMVEQAKEDAKLAAEKVMADAKVAIAAEKSSALAELKTQVATMSLDIAETVVKGELSSDDKQKALATKLAEEISLN